MKKSVYVYCICVPSSYYRNCDKHLQCKYWRQSQCRSPQWQFIFQRQNHAVGVSWYLFQSSFIQVNECPKPASPQVGLTASSSATGLKIILTSLFNAVANREFFKLDLNNRDTNLDLEEKFLPVVVQHFGIYIPGKTVVFFIQGS